MEGEFQSFSLEDVCLGIYDCPHSTPKLSDTGPFMVRTQDIRQGFFDMSSAVRVSEEVYVERTKRVTPRSGDILFSREGTYFGDAAEVPENIRVCLGQRMVLIRPNPEIISPSYLRIQINSPSFQSMISQYRDGTVAERLNLTVIRKLPVRVPPLKDQEYFVANVACLESKIELNRQMNATLEAMAQALFKSWFVDFDPVIDNALAAGNSIPEDLQTRADARAALGDKRQPLPQEIQKQFPTRFVFTEEMGWVPEGWKVGRFKDISHHVKDGVKAEDVAENDFYVGLEHVGRKQIFLSENGAGESIKSNKSRFAENDLLFGKLRPYFHKVCVAPQKGICSTDILVFRSKKPVYQSYMYLTAFSEAFVDYANMRSTGTRMPRASAKDMLDYEIIIPPESVLELFQARTAPFLGKGKTVESGRVLAKLRDTLLPKLLSGKLRIPDAEKLAAEAV